MKDTLLIIIFLKKHEERGNLKLSQEEVDTKYTPLGS